MVGSILRFAGDVMVYLNPVSLPTTFFANDESVANFFAFVSRNVIVFNKKKRVSSIDAFRVGRGPSANPLAQAAELICIGRIPDRFELGIAA